MNLDGLPYAFERKAGAIEQLAALANADNPGALHFVIHAYDQPGLAPFALAAADRYLQAAPVSRFLLLSSLYTRTLHSHQGCIARVAYAFSHLRCVGLVEKIK